MPDSDNFLPVRLLHVTKEMYTTAIDVPNLPRHRLRYGPKEIRATRNETGKTRDLTRGGDPESLHYVPRPRQTGGKMYQYECRHIPRQLLHIPQVQEG